MNSKQPVPSALRSGLLMYGEVQRTVVIALCALAVALGMLAYAPHAEAVAARSVSAPFYYTFNSDGVLHETGDMSESSSPYFWLNSGGKMIVKSGLGGTIQGALSASDRWASLYKAANALDTDQGKYPQNLFRLVTRSTWENQSDEVRFRINGVHLTNTPNRDGYSGVLLMTRYVDGANLYYAGVRMDGAAVIKKKYKGTYYTLATKSGVFPGTYNKTSNPNLIPENTWMGLKLDSRTQPDGSVRIVLKLDRGNGSFEEILSATDTSAQGGGVLKKGYAGIRTDYLDASFDYYKIQA